MNTELQQTYDRIAEDWHKNHQADDWWVEGTNLFLSLLPKGASILDVGCGSGVKARYMLEQGFQVTGIDISNNLLAIAKRESPGGEFKQHSMTDLNSMADMFDGVFAQASLLHIPKKDAAAVVAGMAQRVKPGGLAYLAVKELRDDKPEEGLLQENDYGYPYERFFSYFTMAELEEYLAAAGLQVVQQSRNPSPSGKTVWLQIIGRRC